jgi:N-carbamoylputrescine amidase
MAQDRLAVALASGVFPEPASWQRELPALLADAVRRGAELVVLPELALNPWSPAQDQPRDEDAEPPIGPRHRALAAAAAAARVGVLGGAIVSEGGVRRNRALLFGRDGALVGSYDKAHLPHEEGFWEKSHYRPGDGVPKPMWVDGFALGVQLCSDLNRPELGHAVAAAGALAILGPRATEAATWQRWKLVLQATAMTACCYVLSVTRPRPEQGVPLGGPSFAAAPDGSVLLESNEPLVLVTLERAAVARAREGYPGYLAVRPDLYARAWEEASRAMAIEAAAAADDTDLVDLQQTPRDTTRPFEIQRG